jgi:RNA polymerase sigma factor (sigma-70 family)
MTTKTVDKDKKRKITSIETHLKNYQQYKIGIRNLKLQIDTIMPSMTATYELREGSTGTFIIKSDTEDYAIDRIESKRAIMLYEEMKTNQLIIDCIDAAIEGLEEDEQNFVNCRYIYGMSARKTAENLGYSESSVFVMRTKVMDKLIHSLGGLSLL